MLFLVLNYLSFLLSSVFKSFVLKRRYDLIYVYQLSPVYSIFAGWISSLRNKAPLYVYICDVWPDSLKNIIKNENNIIYRINYFLSGYLYRKADGIGVTSPAFINYLTTTHKVNKSIINYVPQHAEDELLIIDKPIDNGIIDFMFMGNIGLIQDIDIIINAVEMIKNVDGFVVHFVGDGTFYQKAIELTKEKQLLNKIVFHGHHNFSNLKYYYNIADICILTLNSQSIVGDTIPSKLQGYMAAGRPVVAAINGASADVINESKCGFVAKAGDFRGLSELFIKMINSDSLKEYGQNGRDYFVKNYTLNHHVNSLLFYLDKLILEDKNV
jgi:glycosyltransferase involved in cell wall biosynthesis